MRLLSRLRASLRALFHKEQAEKELDDELRTYIEIVTQEKIRAGLSPERARREALMQTGSIESVKEKTRGAGWESYLEAIGKDLKYGFRLLLSNRGFAVVAILTLALGIGANTAVFSILNALFSVPIPVGDPDKVMVVRGENLPQNIPLAGVSAEDYLDWVEQNQSFEMLVGGGAATYNFAGEGEPVRLTAFQFTPGFFKLVGNEPVLGRGFLPEEAEPGGEKVTVLSHSFWQQRFGGAANVLGKNVLLDGESYTIAGVTPEDFFFPSRTVSLWTPLVLERGENKRNLRNLFVLGRLKENVTTKEATAEMQTITKRLADAYPDTNKDWGATVVTFREGIVSGSALALQILYTAISFVLLIACINVANLLLGRAASREKEIALRTALGAGRFRLIRQLLTESVVLALLSGTFGLLLGLWGMDILKGMFSANPQLQILTDAMRLDTGMLAHTIGISMVAGIIFGLVPALQSSKPDLQATLKEGGRGSGGGASKHRLRSILVVSQVALALALLITTTMFIRALGHVWNVDPGFDKANLLTMQISLPEASYPEDQSSINFYREAVPRISDVSGVVSATAVSQLPFTFLGNNPNNRVVIESLSDPEEGSAPTIVSVTVSPSYFETLAVPILQGRGLTEADNENTMKVAVVSEAFVLRYWPDTPALGKRFRLGGPNSENSWVTVVGVSREIHTRNASITRPDPALPHAFLPLAQNPLRATSLILKTEGDPTAVTSAVRKAIWSIDPNQPVANVISMEDQLQQQRTGTATVIKILGALSVIALVLAAVGIYGVISYSVSERTHEIGVRMALGAQPTSVLRLVMRQGAFLTGTGAALGLVLSAGLIQLLKTQLSGLSDTGATDPFTYGGMALLLLVVSLLASYIPARRATRVDPMVALRYE